MDVGSVGHTPRPRPLIPPHPNPTAARLAAAAALLGVWSGSETRARKHGYRPHARVHVERFLLVTVCGVRPTDMARAQGYHRATIFRSVALGRSIARRNALRLGLRGEDLVGPLPGGDDDDGDDDTPP